MASVEIDLKMNGIEDIKYLSATRALVCENLYCKHNCFDKSGCNLKNITMDENGKCAMHEKVE